VEDHSIKGGLGTTVAENLVEQELQARLVKLGIREYPMSGSSTDLYKWAQMDTISIVKTIKKQLG
jgi:transketolase C-terminal domain/subunit